MKINDMLPWGYGGLGNQKISGVEQNHQLK